MMVQNEHWYGQPRPASKLVDAAGGALDARSAGISGIGVPSMPGQVVHEIVERLEGARDGIAQHLVEPALGLAGEQRDAERLRAVEIGIDAVEHADRAGDMEAADADRDAARAQRRGDIERAGKLVRLHADQHDHAGARALDHAREAIGADAGVGLVEGVDFDVDVGAENGALGAVPARGRRARQASSTEWASAAIG